LPIVSYANEFKGIAPTMKKGCAVGVYVQSYLTEKITEKKRKEKLSPAWSVSSESTMILQN